MDRCQDRISIKASPSIIGVDCKCERVLSRQVLETLLFESINPFDGFQKLCSKQSTDGATDA